MNENPYTILGLMPQASTHDIKRAYFTLVRQYPPETNPSGFKRIRAAYDALRTPGARANTDRQIVQAPPPYVPPRRFPPLDLTFHPEDRWIDARRASDLDRTDFNLDFRPIPSLDEVAI